MMEFLHLMTGVTVMLAVLVRTNGYVRVDVRKRVDDRRISLHSTDDRYIRKRSIEIEEMNERDLLLLEPEENLEEVNMEPSSIGVQVKKYQETYKNIPVFDGIVTVEKTRDGRLTGDASGTLIQKISDDISDIKPALSRSQILEIAIEEEGDSDRRNEISDVNIELWIYPGEGNTARLVYFVQYLIEADVIKRPSMILDASNGKVILRYDALDKAFLAAETINRTSLSLYAPCQSINGVGGNKKMGKIEYGQEPYCIRPKQACYLENSDVRVVDMMESIKVTDRTQDPVSFWCNELPDDKDNRGYSPSLDAFFYGNVVSKMYSEWVGGSPLEDTIVLQVHYGTNLENALWNGKSAKFGDGAKNYYPFVSLDIVGHEIGHAVVGRHSKLLQFRQSGGINEAFADIMGESAVAYLSADQPKLDWKIGAEITKTKPYLRSFDNPAADGISINHLDNYTDYIESHFSSGVFRLAFYTLVTKYNVSIKNAFQAFDRANKLYWHHMSSFFDAGCQVIKAAYDLGQDDNAYRKAFDVVGISGCSLENHIRSLAYLKRYDDILVSNESKPMFKFTAHPFAGYVSVLAESDESDINILLYNTSTADEPFESGENKIGFFYEGGKTVYIRLSTEGNVMQKVTLAVPSVRCYSSWQSPLRNGTFAYKNEMCKYAEYCGMKFSFC